MDLTEKRTKQTTEQRHKREHTTERQHIAVNGGALGLRIRTRTQHKEASLGIGATPSTDMEAARPWQGIAQMREARNRHLGYANMDST